MKILTSHFNFFLVNILNTAHCKSVIILMTIETTLIAKLCTKKPVYISSPIAISASECTIYSKMTNSLSFYLGFILLPPNYKTVICSYLCDSLN